MASEVIAEMPVRDIEYENGSTNGHQIILSKKLSNTVPNLNIIQATPDEEKDVMLDSLLNLSKATAMSANTRLRKISLSPIPYRDVKKNLTFTLNETYFTNGKPSKQNENISEVQEIIGSKKNLFDKTVNSIGTSLKNFVVSDMISIGKYFYILAFFLFFLFNHNIAK
jgi:hypothetical protein